jgi:hypothetical protein
MVLHQDRKSDSSLREVQVRRRNGQSAKETLKENKIKFRNVERCRKNLATVDTALPV